MDATVIAVLSALKLGEIQTHENMAVIPLSCPGGGGPEYRLLGQALSGKTITITEVSEGGSVPELKVTNTSAQFVLLLDGEELAGAKQNRVLNTTILIAGNSVVVVPVSCTESGRWAYRSAVFAESGTIMERRSRADKSRSVSASLAAERGYRSDQREVWDNVARMQRESGTSSGTSAMHDVYAAKAQDLGGYTAAFQCRPDQQGCLVFINGEPAGLDLLSRSQAYSGLHAKLMGSYAMDALLLRHERAEAASAAVADAFVGRVKGCSERSFPSTGQGTDLRYTGDGIVGSALVCEGSVVHLAFFAVEKAGDAAGGAMSSMSRRRQYRTGRE